LIFNAFTQTYSLVDTNFVKFLKATYPTTINTKNELIITEAAKIQGTFSCVNRSVANADGLQFFTGISRLIVQKNSIKSLPDLSTLIKLLFIDVSENQITYIPDLSKLVRLKELFADGNSIQILPDFSGNDSLITLSAHGNKIDTIIGLSKLKKLGYLQLSYNKLKYLPGVDSLFSLGSLMCWKNNLQSLPSLANLLKLSTINVSYNSLKEVPELGNKPLLSIAYFNDNQISVLKDDFSRCSVLNKVRLYYNPITFGQLIQVSAKSGYDTIFKMNPQLVKKVAYDVSYRENTRFSLSTNIAKGIKTVSYDWYKNGIFFKNTLVDSLIIKNVSITNSGKYYCVVKSSLFSDFFIKTDTFTVTIRPCVDTTLVGFVTEDISCEKGGQISIIDKNTEASTNFYTLVGKSGQIYNNKNNHVFLGLNELDYQLKVTAFDGCNRNINRPIVLAQKPCEEYLIYPDQDVNNSVTFADSGEVKIYDKRGELVNKFSIPSLWQGTGSKSQKLSTGFYIADINNGAKIIGITILH
jgi:hypothetical protein